MKSFYESLIKVGDSLQSFVLLAIRLFWGYQLFQAGWGKLQEASKIAPFFADLGIPFPELNVYIAGGVEAIGGLLLIFGLASRLATIPVIFVMIVAYLTAHFDSVRNIFTDPNAFVQQSPFNFMLACLIIFAFGPGKISLDYLLGRFVFKSKSVA